MPVWGKNDSDIKCWNITIEKRVAIFIRTTVCKSNWHAPSNIFYSCMEFSLFNSLCIFNIKSICIKKICVCTTEEKAERRNSIQTHIRIDCTHCWDLVGKKNNNNKIRTIRLALTVVQLFPFYLEHITVIWIVCSCLYFMYFIYPHLMLYISCRNWTLTLTDTAHACGGQPTHTPFLSPSPSLHARRVNNKPNAIGNNFYVNSEILLIYQCDVLKKTIFCVHKVFPYFAMLLQISMCSVCNVDQRIYWKN